MKRQPYVDLGVGIVAIQGIKFVRRTDRPPKHYATEQRSYTLELAYKGNTACPLLLDFGSDEAARDAAYHKLRDAMFADGR